MDAIQYTVDREKIFWRQIAEETVVLNVANGFSYTLDEMGTHIWKMTVDQKDLDYIVSKITEEYEVDAVTCQNDVKAFLKHLEHGGFFKKN